MTGKYLFGALKAIFIKPIKVFAMTSNGKPRDKKKRSDRLGSYQNKFIKYHDPYKSANISN